MESNHSGLEMVRLARTVLAVAMFFAGGCAHVATVRETRPPLPVATNNDEQQAREMLSAAAREQQPLASLADNLTAAKLSLSILEQRPNDSSAQSIYNFSVARTVENVKRAGIQPWQHQVAIDSASGKYTLSTPKPVDSEHDPDRYDLFPIDSLKIGGTFFKIRSSVSGVGAPLVAAARSENPRYRQQYRLARVYAPVTAVIRFSGQKAQLEFIDPMKADRVVLNKRTFPLAADFSAPTAMLVVHERPERLGFSRVMNPEKYADTVRLCQLQQYDPNRTPVIFVHGLQETGASWAPMIDSLRKDPAIRARYQFWFFSYPSGYPYPYSAALFRHDLDGIERAFPDHKRVILIGHSMGGMISRLMVTDSENKIWRSYFATNPEKTPLAGDVRRSLEEAFVFKHRPEVKRVIFISTPHRGSGLASSWVGRLGASFVKTPPQLQSAYAAAKPLLINDPAVRSLKRMPNSVDTLEARDRFVEAVNKLPIASGIPYHSIIGDRGRGDTPNSSDGVVPYWSSHLKGAESELIVNSNHGAQYNQQAIREVERILKLNP